MTVSFQNLAHKGRKWCPDLLTADSLVVSALFEEVGHMEVSTEPGRGIKCVPQLSSLITPALQGKSKTVPHSWRKDLAVHVRTGVAMVKLSLT